MILKLGENNKTRENWIGNTHPRLAVSALLYNFSPADTDYDKVYQWEC